MFRRLRIPLGLLLIGVTVATVSLSAQFRSFGPRSRVTPGVMPERTGFTFCRLAYTPVRSERGGSGWDTDFPLADENLMIRLADFTLAEITRLENDGAPAHAIVTGTDDILFQCPFLFASDVGTLGFSNAEVEKLREYFLKGGMLWVDDFWGSRAWQQWTREIGRVLPEYEIVELPMDHPIFSTFYFVDEVPQIPSIQHWRRNGGSTSERGNDSAVPRIYGIMDEHGRILVLMSHNTDIADGWEREGEDFEFFHSFSPHGYSVGINAAIWSLTH